MRTCCRGIIPLIGVPSDCVVFFNTYIDNVHSRKAPLCGQAQPDVGSGWDCGTMSNRFMQVRNISGKVEKGVLFGIILNISCKYPI